MKYLTQIVETYRVDDEEMVLEMIEEAKKDKRFTLIKHTSQYKEKKAKGEVIDCWYKVSLTKQFCDEKEPDATVTIEYKE
jgi:hypothetical protein